MQLYDTLSRSLVPLKPLAPPRVTFYSCGPTVYGEPHIGNWYSFLRWDILVRCLKANGLQPNWAMNITDVGHLTSDADNGEDKLQKGARRENKTAWQVAEQYTNYFVSGLERLNFTMPDQLPKATDHIPQQIELVRQLEAKGHTYVIDDGVYFDTSTLADYGKLAKLDIEQLQAGARVEFNTQKRHATDFALWKFSPKDEVRDMEWESPWGKGFPGWHIECSAMSMEYLGQTLDIHAGGIDHIPVHHTNEIAQSEAATGKPFANIWVHNNFIKINGQKMSKSLGNLITLEDIEAKGYNLMVFRLHSLESHYRTEAQFSWESLQASANRLSNWLASAALRWQPLEAQAQLPAAYFNEQQQAIIQAISDDLDTPKALAAIDQVFTKVKSGLAPADIDSFTKFLEVIEKTLGINLLNIADIPAPAKQLITDRQAAKTAKNYAQSDQIRDQLLEQGIAVRDTPLGTIWSNSN